MAEYTPNLNLIKPDYGEYADVDAINDDMDIIDAVVKQAQDDILTKINKPVGIVEGKFLQTDSNGEPVWGDAADQATIISTTEEWLSDHVNTNEFAVDDTLLIAGDAADSKVTGEKISNVRNAIFVPFTDPVSFSRGALNGSTGAVTTSTTRLYTPSYIPKGIKRVYAEIGYKVLVYVWDNNGTYLGKWTGSGTDKSFATWGTDIDIGSIPYNYNVKLMVGRTDDTDIQASEGSNIKYTGVADKTLSTEGAAAEAVECGKIKKSVYQFTHNKGYALDSVDLTQYSPVKGVYSSHAIIADSTRVITKDFVNVAGAAAIRVTVPSGYRYVVIGFEDNDLSSTTKLWTDWQSAENLYFLKGCNYILIEINNTNESSTAVSDIANVDVELINMDMFENTIAEWTESETLDGKHLINFYQGCKYGTFNGTTWDTNKAFLSTDYIDIRNQRTVIVKNTKEGLLAEYFILDGNKSSIGWIERTAIGDQFAIDVSCGSYIVIVFRKSDSTEFGNADAYDYIKIVSVADSETDTTIQAQNNFRPGVIVSGDIQNALTRIATRKFIDVSNQSIIGITVTSGYYFGLAFYTSASLAGFVRQVQWIQGTGEEVLFDVSYYKTIRIQLRRSDNADMSVSEGSAITNLRGFSKLMGMGYGLKETINSMKEYEGERISINPSLNWYPIVNTVEGTGISYSTYPQQGAAQHNGTLFLFRHGGQCVSFDLETLKLIDVFEITDISADEPHDNCASFGNEYPANNTDYPYLYLSRDGGGGDPSEPASQRLECLVLNITEESASLVQKIRYENGCACWIVDNDRSRLIGYGHVDGENGYYYFKEFALPAVSEGIVNLTDADILDSWEVRRDVFNHQFGACQGWTISGKYIIGCVSNPTINEEQLIVFDKYEHRMVSCYVWNKSITDETQQAVVYNGALYIVSELARIDKVIFN